MGTAFSALESARQALSVSQTELEVTSQNIANASTTGYTRERVVTSALAPDIGGDKVELTTAQAGRGVTATNVEQVRDSYLDARYRTENASYQYYSSLSDTLSQVEDIVNELGTGDTAEGLGGQLSDLEANIQKMQASPDDANVAGAVRSSMDLVCQTARLYAGQLTTLSSQEADDLKLAVNSSGGGRVNTILGNITSLNTQISNYELSGQTADDLRDQRNNLLDELSGYMGIQVTEQKNGMDTVALQGDSSQILVDSSNKAATLTLSNDNSAIMMPDGTTAKVGDGKLQACLDILNGDGADNNLGIPAVMSKLNDFATSLVSAFNGMVTDANASGKALLKGTDAASLDLSDDWKQDSTLFIENSPDANVSDYVGRFISLFSSKTAVTSGGAAYNGTLQEFADSISVDVGDRLDNVNNLETTSSTVTQSLSSQRQAVSGVSINEEAVNLIKYQQSYSAAAKVITTVNDMLDALMAAVGS